MTGRHASLRLAVGEREVRLQDFEADFDEAGGGEVLVHFRRNDGPAEMVLEVYGPGEIPDGGLSCALTRRASVAVDVEFLVRLTAEALRSGAQCLSEPDADVLLAAIDAARRAAAGAGSGEVGE